MFSSIKFFTLVLLSSIAVLFSAEVQAQATNTSATTFHHIYKNMLAKMSAPVSASEKTTFLKDLDNDYEKRVSQLRSEGHINTPEYNAAWDIYRFVIPFLKLRPNATGQSFTVRSCLEAQSLVDFITLDNQSEETVKVLQTTARTEILETLKLACAQ